MGRTRFVLAAALLAAACSSSDKSVVDDAGAPASGGQGGSGTGGSSAASGGQAGSSAAGAGGSSGPVGCSLGGTLTQGCEIITKLNETVTLHTCNAYHDPGLASTYIPKCTTQATPGTTVSSCPTGNLTGVCNLCGYSTYHYSDALGANAGNEQSTCTAMGGTWDSN